MFLGKLYIRRATRGGHKRLTFFEFFEQFMCLVADGTHSTFGNFYHIGKTNLFECPVNLFYRGLELSENRRSYDSHHLFATTDTFEYVEYLRYFEDGTKRTGINTFAAVDTFAFVDMLYTELIFTDCLHRTRLLARNRNINYCVVRTTLVTYTATNASVVVYLSLTVFLKVYRIFRTIGVAAAGYATLTEIGYFVVYLHARRARLVYDAEDVLFYAFSSVESLSGIGRQRSKFVFLIVHIETQQREGLVLPYRSLFVDATPPQRFRFLRTQF